MVIYRVGIRDFHASTDFRNDPNNLKFILLKWVCKDFIHTKWDGSSSADYYGKNRIVHTWYNIKVSIVLSQYVTDNVFFSKCFYLSVVNMWCYNISFRYTA